ncbi:tetratricopeptide repeat protein [Streptomyces sp. NPDC090108]|uniref:tetratricopeptide repeat protein n=1 Tax=Streptomyces sp. NPDC090108 TaxID=3365947 RepID=UPI003804E20C
MASSHGTHPSPDAPGDGRPGPAPVSAAGDVYIAHRDQIITHVRQEDPGLAGPVSITPRRTGFPVRGRSALLKSVLDSEPGSVHVVHAAGGYGKTTTALDLAAHARTRGRDVWWISAADYPALSAGMRALALRLGASPERVRLAWSGHDGDAPELVWELLALHPRPWFLVIDGADDTRILAPPGGSVGDGNGWLRTPGLSGTVLVTSRNGNAEVWGAWQRHALRELTTRQAAQILRDRAGPGAGSLQDAERLADRLGRMPLVLHQAGLYLARVRTSAPWPGSTAPTTFDAYRAALDERFGELVDGPVGTGSAQRSVRVTVTWEISLDLLGEQGVPNARALMRLFSHCADVDIPYVLMAGPETLARSPLFTFGSTNEIQRTIDGLADFGLLLRNSPAGGSPVSAYSLVVHPVIGETMRASVAADGERGAYVALGLHGLAAAVRGRDSRNTGEWSFRGNLLSHAMRLSTLAQTLDDIEEPAAAYLFEGVAACMDHALSTGSLEQAVRLREDAEPMLDRLPAAHPSVLQFRYQAARLKDRGGDPAAGEEAYRRVLGDQSRVLGPVHPETLRTRHALAWLLGQKGNLAGAEAEYRAVLAERTRVLGASHPQTLWTRHDLALVLVRRGSLAGAEAEAEYRAVLAERTRVLGASHVHTLWTRHDLAAVLARQGDLAAAGAEYRALLAERTRALGASHPDTLAVRHALLRILVQQGEVTGAEAEAEYQALLEERTRVLGAYHPQTLGTRHDLAWILARHGQVAAAQAEYRAALEGRTRVLGEEHPDTRKTRRRLSALESG